MPVGRARSRVTRLIITLALATLCACTSAEEKCEEARGAAETAWAAYADKLSAERDAHKKTMVEGKLLMEGEIDARLAKLAQAEATKRHNQGTTEWHRAYSAHYKASCTQDEQCAKTRLEMSGAETRHGEIAKELRLAEAASKAAANDPAAAIASAAAAVVENFEHPEYKTAMAASQAAQEACADL